MSNKSVKLKSSPIWDYFKLSETDSFKALCTICHTLISRGGKTLKSCSTSALVDHLRSRHGNQFCEYEDKKQAQVTKKEEKSQDQVLKKPQPSVTEFFRVCASYHIHSKRAEEIHAKIVEMLAIDCQPLSIVEDSGFIRLLHTLDPRYEIPSRRFITEISLPQVYEKVHKKVESLISEATDIAFTTDIWTCTNNNNAFISLTAQWIDENFNRKSALLCCRSYPGSHDAISIAKYFEDMLKEWNISKNQVHAVLRDNASNMIKALTDLRLPNLSCFIHSLQLCVNKCILAQRSVIDIIAIAKKIVGHFHHSQSACSKLQKIQEQLDLPKHKLKQDVATRWNSTYDMLLVLLEQKAAVTVYAMDGAIPTLTNYQWGLVEKVINVLKPAEEITKKMSCKSTYVSFVIPAVRGLVSCYTNQPDSEESESEETETGQSADVFSGVKTMKDEMLGELLRRFNGLENVEEYAIATFIDPRYKDAFFQDNGTKNKVKITIQTKVQQMLSDSANTDRNNANSQLHQPNVNPKERQKPMSPLDYINEIAIHNSSNSTGSTSQHDDCGEQIARYLADGLQKSDSDPLLWWRENKHKFPELSIMARKYLCPPPSSVDSERLFSIAGCTYTDKRSRLGVDNAEKLLFLHDNLVILDFKY